MITKRQSFKTYNSVEIPSFIYGTAWKKNETARLVSMAVNCGFKAIDTANQLIHYEEKMVGDALISLRNEGAARDAIFIQTKFTSVNGQDHRTPYDASQPPEEQVRQSFASSLQHFQTDYIDSFVLHGPYSRNGLTKDDWAVWKAIEELYREGKTRVIGVSNVNAEQLRLLCENADTKPMVVQNRCYAVTGWDRDVRAICDAHNVVYQCFSLLTANSRILADPFVKTLAARLSVAVTQVIFAFALHVKMLPLTGTSDQSHMKDDLQSVNLELTEEEVSRIETLALY